MNSIKYNVLATLASCLLICSAAQAGLPTYVFTGASDNDFFNVLNWDDGLGGNPGAIVDGGTSRIELQLLIDGDSVAAADTVEFGAGSLSLSSGSILNVTVGEMAFRSGSSLAAKGATINVTGGSAGQFDMFTGSTGVIVDTFITAADDITLRGDVTLTGATVSSTGDDVEFWETGTLNISGSTFMTDPSQVTFFKDASSGDVAYSMANSSITTGRVSIENDVTLTIIDSVISASGDIEEALDGDSPNPGALIAQGTSSVTADQIEHSVQLVLEDAAIATFTDDEADSDGGSWILDSSTVTLTTLDNVINVPNPFSTDARGALVDGRTGLSYAADPDAWNPNNWDGMAALTGRLAVPEPSGIVLLLLCSVWFLPRRVA